MPRRLRGRLDLVDDAGATLGAFDVDAPEVSAPAPSPAPPPSLRQQVIGLFPCNHTAQQIADWFDWSILNVGVPGVTNSLAAAIHAVKPARVLYYDFPTMPFPFPAVFPYWPTIVLNESWIMHNVTPISSANRVTYMSGTSRRTLMDPSSAGYRTFYANWIRDHLIRYGYDGVFLDGPGGNTSIKGMAGRTATSAPGVSGWELGHYPTAAQIAGWHASMVGFLQVVRDTVRPRLVITNSTHAWEKSSNFEDDTDFLPVVDGTLLEGFGHHTAHPLTAGTPNEVTLTYQGAAMQRNLDRGKYFWALAGGSGGAASVPIDHDRWRLFCYSKYLLKARDWRGIFNWRTSADACAPASWPSYNQVFFERDLGTPLGPETADVTGVWRRDFAGGRVFVNASAITRMRDGISLAPFTAMIT